MSTAFKPRGLLFDFGGTLVEELGKDVRAAQEWLLSQAAHVPENVTLDDVLARATRITREVAGRRDELGVETPWPTLTRLIHDYFGVRFSRPMAELELGFWQAAVRTRPMPGVAQALDSLHALGLPMAVVSNTCFGPATIQYELEKQGLFPRLQFVVASANYSVRKPSPLLFEIAAIRLGVAARDIAFVGDRLDTDVLGARRAGMKSVWLDPEGRPANGADPDWTVASWAELAARVSRAVLKDSARPMLTPK
ncbi:MAG: HAD family hydrolase [Polyangiaceae bacterium]